MLTDFEKAVLSKLKEVPRGRVTTYGELAKAAGRPRAARAAGNAVHKNPWAPKVPCHRVVLSSGRLGGYARGPGKKKILLSQEGISVINNRIKNFNLILYKFFNNKKNNQNKK